MELKNRQALFKYSMFFEQSLARVIDKSSGQVQLFNNL